MSCCNNTGSDLTQYFPQKIKNASWGAHAWAFFAKVKKEIDESVKFSGKSKNRSATMNGPFPQKYRGLISPSKDPLGYFSDLQVLTMPHFCLPDLLIWYPEAEYPSLYPDALPNCKWCGTSWCVSRDGWMETPLRADGHSRNVALLGKKYYCVMRQKGGLSPWKFNAFDSQVIEQSDPYIKMKWRTNGFDISHRGAISLSLLRGWRFASDQGISVNAFRLNFLHQQKQYHLALSLQWKAYIEHIRRNPPKTVSQAQLDAMPTDFVSFESKEYDQTCPSYVYLTRRLENLKESEQSATTEGDELHGAFESLAAANPTPKRRIPERKQHMRRCRRCGHSFALPEWQPYHDNWGNDRYEPDIKVSDVCTVDECDFVEGFPLAGDEKMPRKSRAKRKVGERI